MKHDTYGYTEAKTISTLRTADMLEAYMNILEITMDPDEYEEEEIEYEDDEEEWHEGYFDDEFARLRILCNRRNSAKT